MRKKILLLSIAFLLPGVAFAAYNDVVLTKDVTYLTVGGKTIGIDTSNATIETITVGVSDFSFTLQPGSILKASSTGLYRMTSDAASSNIVADTCNSTVSSLQFKNTNSGYTTITVTPSSTLCADAVAVVTSSSGGGSVSVSSIAPTTTVKPVTANIQATAQTTTSFGGMKLTKRLTNGSLGTEVTNLQKYLATDPMIYPEGKVTGTFGSLTKKAVQRFQEKYGIAKVGVSGYGDVGPATRAKLNALMTTGGNAITVPVVQTTTTTSATALETQIASLLKMVADLNAQLKAR